MPQRSHLSLQPCHISLGRRRGSVSLLCLLLQLGQLLFRRLHLCKHTHVMR